jgi:hypothetical protein
LGHAAMRDVENLPDTPANKSVSSKASSASLGTCQAPDLRRKRLDPQVLYT